MLKRAIERLCLQACSTSSLDQAMHYLEFTSSRTARKLRREQSFVVGQGTPTTLTLTNDQSHPPHFFFANPQLCPVPSESLPDLRTTLKTRVRHERLHRQPLTMIRAFCPSRTKRPRAKTGLEGKPKSPRVEQDYLMRSERRAWSQFAQEMRVRFIRLWLPLWAKATFATANFLPHSGSRVRISDPWTVSTRSRERIRPFLLLTEYRAPCSGTTSFISPSNDSALFRYPSLPLVLSDPFASAGRP